MKALKEDRVLRIRLESQQVHLTVSPLYKSYNNITDPVLRSACSRRVTTMWVNRPLQVSQVGQLSLSSFRGR